MVASPACGKLDRGKGEFSEQMDSGNINRSMTSVNIV